MLESVGKAHVQRSACGTPKPHLSSLCRHINVTASLQGSSAAWGGCQLKYKWQHNPTRQRAPRETQHSIAFDFQHGSARPPRSQERRSGSSPSINQWRVQLAAASFRLRLGCPTRASLPQVSPLDSSRSVSNNNDLDAQNSRCSTLAKVQQQRNAPNHSCQNIKRSTQLATTKQQNWTCKTRHVSSGCCAPVNAAHQSMPPKRPGPTAPQQQPQSPVLLAGTSLP